MEALIKLGRNGSVVRASGPSWVATLLKVDILESVIEVCLCDEQITDDDLKNLIDLSDVESNLRDTKITGTGLKSLEGLVRIEKLDLSVTQVSDAGLKHIEPMAQYSNSCILAALKLPIEGWTSLKRMTDLKQLYRTALRVSGMELEHLWQSGRIGA